MDYQIISDLYYTTKRSVDVRLSEKVDECTLKKIANEIRNNCKVKYVQTFICYYLPRMKVDHGAWATTNFRPELEVTIMDYMCEFNPPSSS